MLTWLLRILWRVVIAEIHLVQACKKYRLRVGDESRNLELNHENEL